MREAVFSDLIALALLAMAGLSASEGEEVPREILPGLGLEKLAGEGECIRDCRCTGGSKGVPTGCSAEGVSPETTFSRLAAVVAKGMGKWSMLSVWSLPFTLRVSSAGVAMKEVPLSESLFGDS